MIHKDIKSLTMNYDIRRTNLVHLMEYWLEDVNKEIKRKTISVFFNSFETKSVRVFNDDSFEKDDEIDLSSVGLVNIINKFTNMYNLGFMSVRNVDSRIVFIISEDIEFTLFINRLSRKIKDYYIDDITISCYGDNNDLNMACMVIDENRTNLIEMCNTKLRIENIINITERVMGRLGNGTQHL